MSTGRKIDILKATERSDNANATSFIDQFGEDLRFVITWRKWVAWTGRKWCVETGEDRAFKMARKYAERIWDQVREVVSDETVKDDVKKEIINFARQTNDKRRIDNFVSLAQRDERVTIHHRDLDADPYLLNVQNGTLDLHSGNVRSHQREDLQTQMASVNYDQSVACPLWHQTLSLIFVNEALIRYVQVLFGYALSGTTDEHILPICYGSGCNGKSTIWNLFMEMLGDYATLANQDLLMPDKHKSHPTEVASLFGKRFVAISEPEQGRSLNESRTKELTGDRVVTARRMREDFWEFTPSHTFWMSTNHMPKISGDDDGIWRRIKLIPFTVDLREVTTVDPMFHTKLEAETSGILNWALEGWKLYQQHGLKHFEPEQVKMATTAYRGDEDEFGNFLRETYVENAAFIIGATEAYEAYKKFGGKLTQTAFGKQMTKRFNKVRHTTGKYKSKNVYEGIGLLD